MVNATQIIKKIEKAEAVGDYFFDNRSAVVRIYPLEILFTGSSAVHPDDQELASEKVGKNIAYMRAQLKALQYFKKEGQVELDKLKFTKSCISGYGYSTSDIQSVINNYKEQIKLLEKAIHFKREEIRQYLNEQDIVVKRIKLIRSKKDKSQ